MAGVLINVIFIEVECEDELSVRCAVRCKVFAIFLSYYTMEGLGRK